MKTKSLILITAFFITGCTSITPNYDARFGDALREAKFNMTITPDAGKTADSVRGMDGKSAIETIGAYQGTFKAPPPAVNVINIGGAIGGSR